MKKLRQVSVAVVVLGSFLCGCESPEFSPPPPLEESHIYGRQRVYTLIGEVRGPGRQAWTGPITLGYAIDSAGGFTPFADRKRIELRRADGSSERYNYNRLVKGSTNDPLVLPDDTIEVRRSWW